MAQAAVLQPQLPDRLGALTAPRLPSGIESDDRSPERCGGILLQNCLLRFDEGLMDVRALDRVGNED